LREYIDKIGDCYLVVSPSGLYLASTNAEVNSQIAARRVEFPKPIKDYRVVNLYGDNLVTVEGSDWRRHRRILAPAFTEKSNALAWEQSLNQAQGMLKLWARREGNDTEEMKVKDTSVDTATLALHVISGTGFGITQIWPGEDESILGDKRTPGFNTTELTGNHTMTFKESLKRSCAVDIIWLTLVPDWLLSILRRPLVCN
jgi:cytochrome P450